MKRSDIESRVSSGDTNISSSSRRGLEDEFQTPWLLQTGVNSEEDEVESSGMGE
jgi:hypothetical protein